MKSVGAARSPCFDAWLGNPPFLGGSRLTAEAGQRYTHWLAKQFAPAKGQTDLCAYFFRRAADLVGRGGTSGFVATNSIAQGDTAASGLRVLLDQGWRIYAASRTVRWPGKAHVVVSIVHIVRGGDATAPSVLDGCVVPAISDRLEPGAPRRPPALLDANKGVAGLGVRIDGPGFLVASAVAEEPEHEEARRAGVLRPYVGAEELNGAGWEHPATHVIDFHALGETAARERWPELMRIVEERVKPARALRKRGSDWWRFGIPRFYTAYGRGDREVLAAAIYTKHLVWSFVPGRVCLNSKIFVVDTSCRTAFAVLQSRVHDAWAWARSSTLKQDLAYSAQDAFQTFPFPAGRVGASVDEVQAMGQRVHEARAAYMAAAGVGLTVTYNRMRDPQHHGGEIERLRGLHVEMDRAVLAAYGWGDVEVPGYGEPAGTGDGRPAFRGLLVDRLSALGARRADEQRRLRGEGAKRRQSAVGGSTGSLGGPGGHVDERGDAEGQRGG